MLSFLRDRSKIHAQLEKQDNLEIEVPPPPSPLPSGETM